MQWTRCASDVHAIIRRGKNEGTVGEWMRWTFFPPFCLSSFLFAQRVHCRFCCRCCTTPPQRGRRVGSRVAPRATALLYVEQPPSPPPLPVVALLSSFLFSSLLFSSPLPRASNETTFRETPNSIAVWHMSKCMFRKTRFPSPGYFSMRAKLFSIDFKRASVRGRGAISIKCKS